MESIDLIFKTAINDRDNQESFMSNSAALHWDEKINGEFPDI